MDERTGVLWAPTAPVIRDVALSITFSDKTTVVVPIDADSFDLTHAVLPPGMQAKSVGCKPLK